MRYLFLFLALFSFGCNTVSHKDSIKKGYPSLICVYPVYHQYRINNDYADFSYLEDGGDT